ncbi:nuclear-pore anchor [Phalaenopsis equestris]|uniref:nuclear-pore anchor n=1 Tax=Phalaenopsis equestris TaxID=78828 RepID=UPI0009E5B96A|nr:nuclear-pore anchor [Phalaenopsis equestris]
MPLFLSEEEFCLISNDASAVAERADVFICDLRQQLDVVRAEADAKSIAEEQNCALLEQKYASLYSEFSRLQYENAQLSASTEKSLSELADVQAEKHQLHIKAIGKDAELEKLSLEAAELRISKRQLLDLVEQKDAEIRERNSTIQSYVDKIIHMSENNSSRESKLNEIAAELTRCQATCARLTQEKELLEKQNVWLDEELTGKANTLFELRRTQMDAEAENSEKIAELERQVKEYSTSLNHSKEIKKVLELRVKSLEEDLRSSKDIAATIEENFNAELTTVNKLVELYKASSEEWSKKAGELEGVIKALEAHLSQVEGDYKETLEREASLRKDLEKEVTDLKMKLEKCETELENTRKANESSLLPLSMLPVGSHVEELEAGSDASQMLVPRIAAGVSGTALAASLLRDGWSLTKMYEKYQEAYDALRHEKWGRKHAEAILERVLHEIQGKAEMILEERAEHERMVEAYTTMNEKLQLALVEHDSHENTVRNLKAELRRHGRECSIAQKEINDLQKQVTVLLKECQDIQLRCGGNPQMPVEGTLTSVSTASGSLVNADRVISDHLLTFKDINELVEQNVKLRGLVHRLSADEEKKETEMRYNFQNELRRVADDASSKVEVVLKRSEEQASLIESLHSAVAMYKRLYEEEHKFRTSSHSSATAVSDDGKKELMLLFEGSQEVSKKAYEQLSSRSRILEEDIARLSTELISARAERDKMSLEANFSKERLDSFMKEFEHQRSEINAVSVRNMELTHLLIDYQKQLRESSAFLQASEENLRKLSLEVSILKHEREILVSSEKRASEEVQTLMERVFLLQSSLDTIQSAEEVREVARITERRKHHDYLERVERDWAEAKRELQEERDRVRVLTSEKERALETYMSQVEDIRKELANAWHSVATAESRAAVAEARCSELEAKIKIAGKGVVTEIGIHEQSVLSTNEISDELRKAKEELEKVKDEARASKEYMMQYKEMARVNEIALKQLELAHECYKSEKVKMKKLLEDEAQSLKNQVSELEKNYILKCEEAASATEAKENALSSALVENSRLRDEVAEKLTRLNELEIQVSSLKVDLDKEHKRWRIAQDNYERQVILQSEAIQELTNTSRELSLIQTEISRLREQLDAQRAENDLLKLSWETEKSKLEQMKSEAERNSNEMNEQNRILHNRLEALHVRLAEKEHNSVGLSSVSSQEDGDLQKVISYLRRSKEIAETEITLLKQEKIRLQSKIDGALKASESAQALLYSQLENARELVLKNEEFKSLQLQVREINLLRESNIQLREENKHNFEECQKFREKAQEAKAEVDNLEKLLKLKQIEVDDFQKGAELLKIEISNLNNRNVEVLEGYKNIDISEYEHMKDEHEQIKNAFAKKQESIMKLEQELTSCKEELSEREKKLDDAQNEKANLKQEFDKQKRHLLGWKSKNQSIAKEKEELNSKYQQLSEEIEDLKIMNQAIRKDNDELNSRNQVLTKEKEDVSTKTQASAKEKEEFMSKIQALLKEKEELNSKNQAILKQIEDLKSGRKLFGESEQVKKEQDTRLQTLEKTLERVRDDFRNEKQTRKKSETAMVEISNKINMDKQKLEDELQKHKSAISAVLEKTGLLASQLPSGSSLDAQTMAYFQSVSSFEAAKNSFLNDAEGPLSSPAVASTSDNSAAPTGQKIPTQQSRLPRPNSKFAEEREKASSVGKTIVETRKPGRRFVRPSLEKPEEPIIDAEVTGMEISSTSEGKLNSSIESEAVGDLSIVQPTVARKRLASEPEILEGSAAQNEINIAAPPPYKRMKEPELSVISEASDIPQSSENPDTTPLQGITQFEVPEMQISQTKHELEHDKLPSVSNEGSLSTGKEAEDNVPVIEESEEQQREYLDFANPEEVQYDGDIIIEELSDRPSTPIEIFEQGSKDAGTKDILYSATEGEGDKEEGELMPDDPEQQPEDPVSDEGQHGLSIGEGVGSGDEAEDAIEIVSPNDEQGAHDSVEASMLNDVEDVADDSEKRDSSIDQTTLGSERSPEISTGVRDESPISLQQNLASRQLTPNTPAETGESQPARTSRTISISETARMNAQHRQARLGAIQQQPQQQQEQQQQKSPSRGRIPPYRRGGSRGRRGRGL